MGLLHPSIRQLMLTYIGQMEGQALLLALEISYVSPSVSPIFDNLIQISLLQFDEFEFWFSFQAPSLKNFQDLFKTINGEGGSNKVITIKNCSNILSAFCSLSGKKITTPRSGIHSLKTTRPRNEMLAKGLLSMKKLKHDAKYLGNPIFLPRKRSESHRIPY